MNKTSRVLHLIDSGGLYGAESVILNLSQEMFAQGEYEPVIGCIVHRQDAHSALFNKAIELGLPAVKIVIANHLLPIHLPIAVGITKKLHIDLIHCHGYKAFVFGFIIGRLVRLPVLSTCHLWFLGGSPPIKMRAMIQCELFLYRFIRKVVSVSEPIKWFLMQRGIPASRIHIIPNGVRIEDYQAIEPQDTDRLRAELGIGMDEKVVLNVGRLTLQKSQGTLLGAAEILRDAAPKVRFLIVGDGELRQELQSAIVAKRLEKCVLLLGYRRDIKELLSLADLFALVSTDEGMPMSLIEAVASRTPVVSTLVGDIPKLIRHGESGYAVPIGDSPALAGAIASLLKLPLVGEKFAAKAWETLHRRYSNAVMYHDYARLYRTLIGSATAA